MGAIVEASQERQQNQRPCNKDDDMRPSNVDLDLIEVRGGDCSPLKNINSYFFILFSYRYETCCLNCSIK